MTVTLAEVLNRLEEFDDESLICATRTPAWHPDSQAEVIPIPPDDGQAYESAGMEYLLEVFLAKDVLSVWSKWRGGKKPTVEQKIAALEYYNEHDCYQPPEGGA